MTACALLTVVGVTLVMEKAGLSASLGAFIAGVLIGILIANQIARPIGGLIQAAERVRSGDLTVRVTEESTGDELAGLSRAFKTGDLEIPDTLPQMVQDALTRVLLDRLGLEMRVGGLILGTQRIAEAARGGAGRSSGR